MSRFTTRRTLVFLIAIFLTSSVQRLRCFALKSHNHSTQSSVKQDHLGMNVAPDLNNHLRSIDLFRSMI